MKALVTGCAGFIGSHLTEALLADGVAVTGVDCFNGNYARREKLRNLERARDWDAFDFVPLDLARGDLADLVEGADTIFHLAAEPGVRASWGRRFEDYLRNNVLATQHLLEAATAWPEKRLVLASSSSIYGQAEHFPTAETALPNPYSPYGTTKLAAEHLCRSYHANFGLQVLVLRYFSVFGPRQRPDMAFTIFCRAALAGESVTVYGDGTQTRDFTYVADIVAATRAAAVTQEAIGGTFNIGGGSQVTVNEVLRLVGECAGTPLDVRYEAGRHGDVRDTVADTNAARETLGFAPATTLAEGVREQFDWAVRTAGASAAP